MREVQCKHCGALFMVEGDLPKFECTCNSTEFSFTE